MQKECKVIMAPTPKTSVGYANGAIGSLQDGTLKLGASTLYRNYDLFIVTEDTIKSGDWYLHKASTGM